VLVVEDKDSLRAMLCKTLESRGFSADDCGDAYEARRKLQTSRFWWC
jgi:DNA-binding response OmpR family regulator